MNNFEYIKSVRKSLRLNQKEFGKLFNKTRVAIANYECSKRATPPPASFIKEVQALEQRTKELHKTFNEVLENNNAGTNLLQ